MSNQIVVISEGYANKGSPVVQERKQASNQFMSQISAQQRSNESPNTFVGKPDTAKILPSPSQHGTNMPKTAPIEDWPQQPINSLSQSQNTLQAQLTQINNQLKNTITVNGKRYVSYDDDLFESSITSVATAPDPNIRFDMFPIKDQPSSRYTAKHIIENHMGKDFAGSSVLGGPLQRDEKQLLETKKEQQQREMREALMSQMEEKRQQREKQNMAIQIERHQEQQRIAQQFVAVNSSFTEGTTNVIRNVFSPPKITKAIDAPLNPTFSAPMSPSHVKYMENPGDYDFAEAATSAQNVINMQQVQPTQEPSQNNYDPQSLVPVQNRDNSEQCIEYLNVLCQRLMDKQEELSTKVVSQEDEIKNLMEQNKQVTARPVRGRTIKKAATIATSSRGTSGNRLQNMHAERERKTRLIEDKIRNARERAEQWKMHGRLNVAPIVISKSNRAHSQPYRKLAAPASTKAPSANRSSLDPASFETFDMRHSFNVRYSLDSASAENSMIVYPGQDYGDEIDKFIKGNSNGNGEQISPQWVKPKVYSDNTASASLRKKQFPRDIFRAFPN